ncbi:hypothetical protein [Ktedonobacter racemifer]|uniref:Uncharacterized protein n=1 Tax=Ktedonobacter racemifer DSM 44963 TaxID=485913 RepID=D6U8N8_KTERA|nr:hypothetical protein [Ktedonobacter racemifer]EFH79598.1 hypothetical protein Krac_0076 [Ktedonobacter racemifer DSM 44963]
MPPVDVSIGLQRALPLLAEYYKDEAILQAKVPSRTIPGVRERCLCCIHLRDGRPISCYIVKKDGKRQSVDLDLVQAADTKRGPFDWSLEPVKQPQPQPQQSDMLPDMPPDMPPQASQYTYTQSQLPQLYSPSQLSQPSHNNLFPSVTPSINKDAIPIRLRQELDLSWLSSMGRPQQILLRAVFNFINGQRSVAEIKAKFPHVSDDKIEQTIIFLMATHFATFKYE